MARIALVCVSLLIGMFTASAQPLPLPELPTVPYYVPPEYAIDARAASYFVTTTADEDDGICGGGTGISLREAIVYCAQVATSAVVYIPDGTYSLTSEIAVTDRAIRLIGESRDGTIITTAANDHRHLKVMSTGYEFGLFNLAFLHGNSGSEAGGSLYIVGGSRWTATTSTTA
ncbi:MAG: hypothetical protein IPM16_20700 [Chloroflexi bacterium]|nr:hypothetical protein [Chloroflexota bacterium]